jgi:Helix-turn-helix domain
MTAQPAGTDIGPPRQVLDIDRRAHRVSVPVKLIGSPGQAMQVWVYIKNRVDRGQDIPSNEAIAQRCGISKSAVTRAIIWLRKEGWLA